MAQRRMCECKSKSCYLLTRNKSGYCDLHLEEYDKKQKINKKTKNKAYDSIRNDESVAFYHSKKWDDLRTTALIRDNYLCQDCINKNKLTEASCVHHIDEVKHSWDKRFDLTNLTSLCSSCHNSRHTNIPP